MNKGHYGFLYIEDKQVGGFVYWTRSEKDNCYYTNNWWLFENIRKCALTLYEYKNCELKKVSNFDLVELVINHNVILDCEMKGSLKIKSLMKGDF